MTRIFNFTLLLLICSSANSQNKSCFDYQFVGNYIFAEKLLIGNAVLSMENQIYTFGTFDKENSSDTSWAEPFAYKFVDNSVYILKNGEEYLGYSERVGDTVYSLFEYISPGFGFITKQFIDKYNYKSRECLFFENCKEDKDSKKKVTVVCILDKVLKIPLYYEVSMYRFDNLTSRVIYFLDNG